MEFGFLLILSILKLKNQKTLFFHNFSSKYGPLTVFVKIYRTT